MNEAGSAGADPTAAGGSSASGAGQSPGSLRPGRLPRSPLSRAGVNRSLAVRVLVRLGRERLRALRARLQQGSDPLARVGRPLLAWLERGVLTVPQGHGIGIQLHLRHLPISHAHAGSLAHGLLESSVQEAMVRHLAADGVLYDVGANIGFFSLLGARLAPRGRVIALEAAPANAQAIRENAELNGAACVEVWPVAVGARSGRAQLQVVEDQSWSKLAEYGEHPQTTEVLDVEMVSIDDLLTAGRIPPPTLVKIDVEGAELAVIAGMRATIERHRPAIICELHDTASGFLALMRQVGYRVINLEGAEAIGAQGDGGHALALPALHPGD